MKRRILLLPGFGEDASAFNEMRPYLEGFELVEVDYRQILGRYPVRAFSIRTMINELIVSYQIKGHDILIGHSMGGYFAHHIRQIIKCEACLIASFSNPNKPIKLINNYFITANFIMAGGLKWRASKNFSLNRREKQGLGGSRKQISYVLDNFKTFSNADLLKMVALVFDKNPPPTNLPPSLRIHAKADRVVRVPDQPYVEVPGDHFSLQTHPEVVGPIIRNWLNNL